MSELEKLDEVLSGNGDWTQYIARMDQFLITNKQRRGTTKKAILLSSCGAATYSLLHNQVAPAKPLNKNYCELIAVMNEHQNPEPLVIVGRYKFNKETDNQVRAFHLM